MLPLALCWEWGRAELQHSRSKWVQRCARVKVRDPQHHPALRQGSPKHYIQAPESSDQLGSEAVSGGKTVTPSSLLQQYCNTWQYSNTVGYQDDEKVTDISHHQATLPSLALPPHPPFQAAQVSKPAQNCHTTLIR